MLESLPSVPIQRAETEEWGLRFDLCNVPMDTRVYRISHDATLIMYQWYGISTTNNSWLLTLLFPEASHSVVLDGTE